mgnify:CR=1 FL=1
MTPAEFEPGDVILSGGARVGADRGGDALLFLVRSGEVRATHDGSNLGAHRPSRYLSGFLGAAFPTPYGQAARLSAACHRYDATSHANQQAPLTLRQYHYNGHSGAAACWPVPFFPHDKCYQRHHCRFGACETG